jgi:hypothetical protein
MVRNKCETTIRVGRGRAVLRADGSVFVSFPSLMDQHDDDGSFERDFARGHNQYALFSSKKVSQKVLQ